MKATLKFYAGPYHLDITKLVVSYEAILENGDKYSGSLSNLDLTTAQEMLTEINQRLTERMESEIEIIKPLKHNFGWGYYLLNLNGYNRKHGTKKADFNGLAI